MGNFCASPETVITIDQQLIRMEVVERRQTRSGRVCQAPERYGRSQWYSPYVLPSKARPQRKIDYVSMDREDAKARKLEEAKKALDIVMARDFPDFVEEAEEMVKTLEITNSNNINFDEEDFECMELEEEGEVPGSQGSVDSASSSGNRLVVPTSKSYLDELAEMDNNFESIFNDNCNNDDGAITIESGDVDEEREEEEELFEGIYNTLPPFRDIPNSKYAGTDEEWSPYRLTQFPRFHPILYHRSQRVNSRYFL